MSGRKLRQNVVQKLQVEILRIAKGAGFRMTAL